MMLILKENMKKVKVNKNIFHFELGFKPNVDIIGIIVSMCKRNDFETIFTSKNAMKV